MRGAPIPPEEYESSDVGEPMTDEFLERNSWASGLRVWEQLGKAYEWYLGHNTDRPDGLDNAQFWSLQEAIKASPRRGDPVAEWLKRKRDEREADGREDADPYSTIDDLLDDYREHADTGTPLSRDVQGPQGPGDES